MATKPKEISTSVEFALKPEQRNALRNLRNTLQSRHLRTVSAMKSVAKKATV